MPYTVEFKPSAERYFKTVSKALVVRIIMFVEDLAREGDPADSERVGGSRPPVYRVRVGDHRVMYTLEGGRLVVASVEPDTGG